MIYMYKQNFHWYWKEKKLVHRMKVKKKILLQMQYICYNFETI